MNFEHSYECESCGGTFTIIPDLEEEIIYCPQCSEQKTFVHLYNFEYQNDEGLLYDTD